MASLGLVDERVQGESGMSRRSRGARPGLWGVVLVAGLFLMSFAASAGATVVLSESGSGSAGAELGTEDSSTSEATPAGEDANPPDSESSYEPLDVDFKSVTGGPKSAPVKATNKQVKDATSSLCAADAPNLPPIKGVLAGREWTRVLEILAADQGYKVGPIDGFYNNATAEGIASLQAALAQKPDGTFEASDWIALATLICPAPEPPASSTGGGSAWSGDGGSGDTSGDDGGTLVLIP